MGTDANAYMFAQVAINIGNGYQHLANQRRAAAESRSRAVQDSINNVLRHRMMGRSQAMERERIELRREELGMAKERESALAPLRAAQIGRAGTEQEIAELELQRKKAEQPFIQADIARSRRMAGLAEGQQKMAALMKRVDVVTALEDEVRAEQRHAMDVFGKGFKVNEDRQWNLTKRNT